MNYLRRIAVRAVEENHHSPELIANILGISRSCIYDWLRWYRAGGEAALDTRLAPGADPVITPAMDRWLKATILNSTPVAHGYDTELWTLQILVELLQQRFGVWVADSTVALHLHRLNLSCQHPCYRAAEQDPEAVAHFLLYKFPKIEKLAEKIGADIGFEDEAGVGIMTRAGRTWGEVGAPPVVPATDRRGGYNVLSVITATGTLRYSIEAHSIDSERYLAFLQQVLRGRTRPLILLADNVLVSSVGRRAPVRAGAPHANSHVLPSDPFPGTESRRASVERDQASQTRQTTHQNQTRLEEKTPLGIKIITAQSRKNPFVFSASRYRICRNSRVGLIPLCIDINWRDYIN